MKLYDIEFYMPPPVDRWSKLISFQYMRKSYAEGAWAMLRAHYNQRTEHRLLCDGKVIDECGKQTVMLNLTGKNIKVCENCKKSVNIDDETGHDENCKFVYGRRGWRQLGEYDG